MKIFFIILSILLTVALCILNLFYDGGYNLSIYDQVPIISWILFLILNVSGIIIVLYAIDKEKGYWKLGMLFVILINLIVLFLPLLLGYQYNISGDQLTHMGYILDIMNSGHFSQDVYPLIHVLVVQISLLFSIPLIRAENIAGAFFYPLYVLSIYLISKDVFNEKVAAVSALSGTILFFYYYATIIPFGISLLVLVLAYFLYLRYTDKKNSGIAGLLFILLAALTPFHPVTLFLFIFAILIIEIGKLLYSRLFTQKENERSNHLKTNQVVILTFTFALIGFIFFNLWLWSNYLVWNKFVSGLVDLFSSTLATEPLVDKASESLNGLGFSLIDTIELFIKMYGPVFVYGVLSVLAVLPILSRLIERKSTFFSKIQLNERSYFLLALILIFFSLLSVIDFVKPLTSLNSGRLMYTAIIIFPIFGGLTLYLILKTKVVGIPNPLTGKKLLKLNINKIVFPMVILIIAFSSITSIFALYPSPITYQSNIAVTNEQIQGVKWIVDNGNSKFRVSQLKTDRIRRFADSIYGKSFRTSTRYPVENYTAVPDHFNYTSYTNFGNQFLKDSYLITRQNYIIDLYSKVYFKLGRFTSEDFGKLDADNTVNKIYENGEIQNWYIKSNKE